MIEAMADGGVMAGLPRETALALAAKTVAGAAQVGLHHYRSCRAAFTFELASCWPVGALVQLVVWGMLL
jgi:hypothetical protein